MRTSERNSVEPRGFGWRIHCGVEVTELSTNNAQFCLNIKLRPFAAQTMYNQSPLVS